MSSCLPHGAVAGLAVSPNQLEVVETTRVYCPARLVFVSHLSMLLDRAITRSPQTIVFPIFICFSVTSGLVAAHHPSHRPLQWSCYWTSCSSIFSPLQDSPGQIFPSLHCYPLSVKMVDATCCESVYVCLRTFNLFHDLSTFWSTTWSGGSQYQ